MFRNIFTANMWKLTLCLLCVALGVFGAKFKVDRAMEKELIVPEVIPVAPTQLLRVSYPNGVRANCGKVLTPTQVKDQPSLKWSNVDADSFYTICLTNPDIPNRPERNGGEWLHWLAANIPGENVNAGEMLAEYVGSGPRPNSGLHRYVFLVYKQPSKLTFDDEPRITNRTAQKRDKFSINSFALKHDLGTPVAGNFYLAEYDDYVPTIYKQLGVV